MTKDDAVRHLAEMIATFGLAETIQLLAVPCFDKANEEYRSAPPMLGLTEQEKRGIAWENAGRYLVDRVSTHPNVKDTKRLGI
jgi:hypothetical protein